MKFNKWWDTQTSPEFKRDIECYYGLLKSDVENLSKQAKIENSMNEFDAWIFSQPIPEKKKLEFFFSWRQGLTPAIYTKSLGQFTVTGTGLEK